MRPLPRVTLALLALSCAFATATAHANGRFPAAQSVSASADGRTLVLRATFGLLVSRDSGATWGWVCEDAVGYAGVWDPPVSAGPAGNWFAGLPDGLSRTSDLCAFTREPVAENLAVADLANSPDGTLVFGVTSNTSTANRVLVSADAGVTAERSRLSVGLSPWTVEVAPSDPMRVYVTALDENTRAPVLLRSTDGGASFARLAVQWQGATDAFVSAVDGNNPDGLWIRGTQGAGTLLLRSTDGGNAVTVATRTTGPMLGFAVDPTGRHVWLGGPDDGLVGSDDGGASFHSLSPVHLTCLRYVPGALYVCADWLREPYALARWPDGASGLEAVLRFDQAYGVLTCDVASPVTQLCAPRWPAVLAMVAQTDSGVRDARAADVALDVSDAGEVVDAGVADVSAMDTVGAAESVMPPGGGSSCACSAPGAPRGAGRGLGAGLALLAFWLRRRR